METIHRVITTSPTGLLSKKEYSDRRMAVAAFKAAVEGVDSGRFLEVSFTGKDNENKPIEMVVTAVDPPRPIKIP